jgi:hypothetical protein
MAYEIPQPVHCLIEQANPKVRVEYCGAISTRRLDYYLFVVTREQLSGVVLVQNDRHNPPAIVYADTSPFNSQFENSASLGKPVESAIAELLVTRNLRAQAQKRPRQNGDFQEVSSIGSDIDRIIFPISGVKLGSESTQEIIRVLRTTRAISVEPASAAPGSIIISPTRFLAYGPVSIGHAGIVGSDGSIYSADARYGGAWVRNFTLTSWLSRFSASNGTYAFLLRDRSHPKIPRLQNMRLGALEKLL